MTKREFAKKTLGIDVGCSDGGCVYGRPGGMQTNSGCQCLKGDPHELRQHMRRLSILVAAALALTGCLPVSLWDPYEPLVGYVQPGLVVDCSWGVDPDGMVVTAAHCLPTGQAGFGAETMELMRLDLDADYAVVEGAHPEGAREFTSWGTPSIGAKACYYDFRGSPNCGYILWSTDDSVGVMFQTRMIVLGDSGSPLEKQNDDSYLGVVTNRYAGYFGRIARP